MAMKAVTMPMNMDDTPMTRERLLSVGRDWKGIEPGIPGVIVALFMLGANTSPYDLDNGQGRWV